MRKFFLGLVMGWLITNLFSIPLPPVWFWWLVVAFVFAILIIAWIAYLLNNDDYPDIYPYNDDDTETYERDNKNEIH